MNTFPGYGALFGGSPYRELQLYIDGIMAGIVLPFPIVFVSGCLSSKKSIVPNHARREESSRDFGGQ